MFNDRFLDIHILLETNPDIQHDIGRWRLLGIEAGLVSLGLATKDAVAIAQTAPPEGFQKAKTALQEKDYWTAINGFKGFWIKKSLVH